MAVRSTRRGKAGCPRSSSARSYAATFTTTRSGRTATSRSSASCGRSRIPTWTSSATPPAGGSARASPTTWTSTPSSPPRAPTARPSRSTPHPSGSTSTTSTRGARRRQACRSRSAPTRTTSPSSTTSTSASPSPGAPGSAPRRSSTRARSTTCWPGPVAGRMRPMSRPGALAVPGVATDVDVVALRRPALGILLTSKLTAGWGLGWDIRWHVLIGRDSFWIAPHILIYASVAVAVIVSLGVIAVESWTARERGPTPGAIRLLGLVGTRGFHLAWLGMALVIVAAPIDDLSHRLFGPDITLWSPPHLLGLLVAQVNKLACLLIAREPWPVGAVDPAYPTSLATTFLFGTFAIATDPSWRIAFLHGGLSFFTWPVLAALLFAFSLVLGARLSGLRWAPVAVVLLGFLTQLSIVAVAGAGFALLQPASTI